MKLTAAQISQVKAEIREALDACILEHSLPLTCAIANDYDKTVDFTSGVCHIFEIQFQAAANAPEAWKELIEDALADLVFNWSAQYHWEDADLLILLI